LIDLGASTIRVLAAQADKEASHYEAASGS
jgi:hypothetical protein